MNNQSADTLARLKQQMDAVIKLNREQRHKREKEARLMLNNGSSR